MVRATSAAWWWEMGKRAASKPKAKALAKKSKAEEEGSVSSAGDVQTSMKKGDVSRMLGYLKYHARAGNKDDDDKNSATLALSKYAEMKSDKSTFLETFEQNKGNLKWVHNFFKTTEEVQKTKATKTLTRFDHNTHVLTHAFDTLFLFPAHARLRRKSSGGPRHRS